MESNHNPRFRRPVYYPLYYAGKFGGHDRGRTSDTRIFNPLLYQLSYTAIILVLPPGIEPGSSALQAAAMTTSAKAGLIGAVDGNRTRLVLIDSQLNYPESYHGNVWYRWRESNPPVQVESLVT